MRSPVRSAVIVVSALGLGAADHAVAGELFHGPPEPVAASAALSVGVTDLLRRPSVAQAWWVDIDDAPLHPLPDALSWRLQGQRLRAEMRHQQTLASGHHVWQGEMQQGEGSAAGTVVLVRSAAGLTGVWRTGEDLFRLVPTPAGRHLLYRVDESQLPPEHPLQPADALPVTAAVTPGAPHQAAAGTSVVRVLVLTSNEARAGYPGDLVALAETAVAEANLSYRNSGIDMRLELAGVRAANYEETHGALDVSRLATPGDGHLDEVHALRDQLGADVVAILLDQVFWCGLAHEIGASAETAFIGLRVDCFTGEYTLAHEVGHLQGARHDIRRDSGVTPFPFGHGHWYQRLPDVGWRTVMSGDCPSGCRRIPYWSTPGMSYLGQPLGKTNVSDNRWVLDLTRAKIAAFRPR